ncbi:MAG TPA: hypothetical protein ENL03_06525 [Phycisphaerae bacterium]|nr:hypothetical protein [Phycisphaerae bacterium]
MKTHLIEEMTPGMIAEIARKSSVVFVPVSPKYEWHGPHLPVGTDGIIAQEVARKLAEEFDGAWFHTLPLALDAFRDDREKLQWGLEKDAEVFGMNFPALEFTSEYAEANDMLRMVAMRLKAIKGSGFRYAFIINHHGGAGQMQTLKSLAGSTTDDAFTVEAIATCASNTYKIQDERRKLYLSVGGHAGLAETHWLMAFRPDLARLGELPAGELSVAQLGILHNEPVIPAELNPRNACQDIADGWGSSVIENIGNRVRTVIF